MKSSFSLSLLLLLLSLSFLLPQSSSAQTLSCKNETFSNTILYATCATLPYFGATLHWTFHPANHTVDIAYRAPAVPQSGWVAWAINPTKTGMIGANAFLAFFDSTESLTVWTYQFESTTPSVQDEDLSFPVFRRGAEYSGGAFTIYAALRLPGNRTVQNTVWQTSTLMANGIPNGHITYGDHTNTKLVLDFESGAVTAITGGNSFLHRKNIHGVLNAISWGTLLPIGVIMSRYLKAIKPDGPIWFFFHIAFQFAGYIIGLSGWALGLNLSTDPSSTPHSKHRAIGITLFCLATLQVTALLYRPKKDSKIRIYWKIYHWSVGYMVVVLSVVNVFKGFDILVPPNEWKRAYIAVLSTLAAVALLLEIYTWWSLFSRKKTMKVAENGGAIHLGGEVGNNGRAKYAAESPVDQVTV